MKDSLHMFSNTERKELRHTLTCTLSRTLLLVGSQRINEFFWHLINTQLKIFWYQIYLHSVLTKWCDNFPCNIALWCGCTLSFSFALVPKNFIMFSCSGLIWPGPVPLIKEEQDQQKNKGRKKTSWVALLWNLRLDLQQMLPITYCIWRASETPGKYH